MADKKLSKPSPITQKPCVVPKHTISRVANNETELKTVADAQRERTNWAGSILGIPQVWQVTQGEGVKVAVLDTGIDSDHQDLAAAIIDTADFTGDGIEDANGHGTHCAGVIGARLNGVGFVGVAPKSELLVAKVLANNGSGAYEWIANGVYWAVDNDADIISMSLGGPVSDPELYRAIQYALFYGVHVICAAGNDGGLGTNTIGYPGRYGGVITVASHDRNGNPSGFSSKGGEVDVMAPGSDIWSTYKNGGYAELSGTSMATPFVAGLAALIVAKHKQSGSHNTPLHNNEDLKNHLLFMAAHPGYHDNRAGYGPLNPFSYFAQ
ncbi:subtilisin Carlsberg [Thalassotalea euphylliae]|uniref:Subtilisin Carlsberg n=1 Tax=Thalassotalea euphylliae TaxID=1655234 RepID=A0A3E0TS12_9GAMM|nr:S8 family peptidase [Thalassotalea euphylliae]REL27117.1 subtilisin Carlsberg [Thalassotalea euphylliae]